MNGSVFESEEKKSKKGFVAAFIIILVVVTFVAALTVVSFASTGKTEGVLKEDDAIILNDIPSLGCVTLYCGQYKKLGYEVNYYQSGTDFDPGMYIFEMKFEDTNEDNQYMIAQTTNNDSLKSPYADGRFISMEGHQPMKRL